MEDKTKNKFSIVILIKTQQHNQKNKVEKGSQNKYAGPFLFSLSLCFIVDAGKPFTNQKVNPFLGNNTLNKLSSHSLTIYTWKTIITHLHHRTSVRLCLSYKLQTIHRTPQQKKKKDRTRQWEISSHLSESVTLSQFRTWVKKQTKSQREKQMPSRLFMK